MEKVEGNIIAFVNPLQFQTGKESPNIAGHLLNFLIIGENAAQFEANFLQRQQRLKLIADKIKYIPAAPQITEKLIVPLRHAHATFLMGNFLGTLALCGTIGEMLTIFWFEISQFIINEKQMDLEDQKSVFGNEFEKLGQDRRINILEYYGVINKETASNLEKIRKIRNNYLHYWNKDHDSIENDAHQTYCATIESVLGIFPQTFEQGRIKLKSDVTQYLAKHGIITTDAEEV